MHLSASTMIGDKVVNGSGEELGKIDEIMLDVQSGETGYAVLSFGGFMGMGDKLFAIPWHALQLDGANKQFILDVPKDRLQEAPGFDKDAWPDAAGGEWQGFAGFWEPYRRN